MRALSVSVALVVVAFTAVGVGAAELATDEAPGLVSFIPGPPMWRLPDERPRAMVKNGSLEDAVDLCVTNQMDALDAPGASVAVIVDGELVYEQGYGVKRRGGTAAVDARTQFRIGSITKMFTAAAVMQQVEAGTVFLDDRLSRHVPELELVTDWPDDAITVEHLLTHSSGLPDLVFHRSGPTGPSSLSDWAASLRWLGLHAPPGAFFNYSNPNFNLAGLVLERASGREFRSYMEDRVFGAAGLSDTTFDPAAVVARGNASHGHWFDGNEEVVSAPDDYDSGAYAPAGYAFSTAGDLARWALLLADGGGAVLSESSAKAMQATQQDLDTIPGQGYGYGIFVEPFFDLTLRQHGGNIWGWGSMLLWHPQRRFAVAVLANNFTGLPGAAYCIADHVLEPDHDQTPDYPFDPERLTFFEGLYDTSIRANSSGTNPYPVMAEVSPLAENQLFLSLWDPEGSWNDLWIMEHQVLDVFYVDVDDDGAYDLDLSFITGGSPERLRWMRMRPLVGHPQVAPREAGRAGP